MLRKCLPKERRPPLQCHCDTDPQAAPTAAGRGTQVAAKLLATSTVRDPDRIQSETRKDAAPDTLNQVFEQGSSTATSTQGTRFGNTTRTEVRATRSSPGIPVLPGILPGRHRAIQPPSRSVRGSQAQPALGSECEGLLGSSLPSP